MEGKAVKGLEWLQNDEVKVADGTVTGTFGEKKRRS